MCRLAIAVGVVILIAVVARAARTAHSKRTSRLETFLQQMPYRPCFIDPLEQHATCPGYTTGAMPSIDTAQEGGWLCPGMIGVPP